MSGTAVLLMGLLIAFLVTYFIRKREEIKSVVKKEVRRTVLEFYIEHVQSYDINTRWVDVLLDYCEMHDINSHKEMGRIFDCFDKDFAFQLTREKEIEL